MYGVIWNFFQFKLKKAKFWSWKQETTELKEITYIEFGNHERVQVSSTVV